MDEKQLTKLIAQLFNTVQFLYEKHEFEYSSNEFIPEEDEDTSFNLKKIEEKVEQLENNRVFDSKNLLKKIKNDLYKFNNWDFYENYEDKFVKNSFPVYNESQDVEIHTSEFALKNNSYEFFSVDQNEMRFNGTTFNSSELCSLKSLCYDAHRLQSFVSTVLSMHPDSAFNEAIINEPLQETTDVIKKAENIGFSKLNSFIDLLYEEDLDRLKSFLELIKKLDMKKFDIFVKGINELKVEKQSSKIKYKIDQVINPQKYDNKFEKIDI